MTEKRRGRTDARTDGQKTDGRMEGRTDGRMDGRTERRQSIEPTGAENLLALGRTDADGGRTAIFAAAAAAAGARRTGPRPRRQRPQKLKSKSPPDGRPSKTNWLRTKGATEKK